MIAAALTAEPSAQVSLIKKSYNIVYDVWVQLAKNKSCVRATAIMTHFWPHTVVRG